MSEIRDKTKALVDFRDERKWKQFHNTKIFIMKRIIILILLSVPQFLIGQKLSLNEFILLCNKKNWNEVNVLIGAKGWEYYNSKAGNSETYNEVSWSFGLEPYNDKAKGWLTLYTYEGLPSKIWFQVFSKKIFTQIETSIASAGFKLINTDISNNIVDAEYSNDKYTLNISYSKIENDDYYESASTAYTIIVTKKGTIYDPDNGRKYEYNDDFQVISEYDLKDGELHGEFISFYPGGAKKTVSHWSKGKLEGKATDFEESGLIFLERFYANDELNGILREFEDGVLIREINFQNGLENGLEKNYYANGKTKSTVAYLKGKKNGVAFEYDEKGIQIIKETYINGIKNGLVEYVLFDDDANPKRILDGKLLNGELDGRIILRSYDTKDTMKIEFFDRGIRTGNWKKFENKKLSSEGSFKNDELEGLFTEYITIGENAGKIICETNYKQGKKHGLESVYYKKVTILDNDENGSIFFPVKENSTYYFDTLNGPYSYDDFKNTIRKGAYKNDLKTGFWLETLWGIYWESAEYPLIYKGNYLNGEKEGEWKGYVNDKLYVTNFFKNGELNGANQFYEENGDLGTKNVYKNDERIEIHLYANNFNNESIFLVGKVNQVAQYEHELKAENVIRTIQFSISDEVSMDDSKFLTYFNEQTNALNTIELSELFNKNGLYYINSPLMIIKGDYLNNKYHGAWETLFKDQNVIQIVNYSIDAEMGESFVNADKTPFNGTLVINLEKNSYSIKIKNGLRHGFTIETVDGSVVDKTKYKEGIPKK